MGEDLPELLPVILALGCGRHGVIFIVIDFDDLPVEIHCQSQIRRQLHQKDPKNAYRLL